jgi:signal transduction histidine kinase
MKLIFFILIGFYSQILLAQNNLPLNYKIADSLFLANNQNAVPIFKNIVETNITDSFKAEVYMRLGYLFNYSNKTDSSIQFFRQALTLWTTEKNNIKIGRTYNGIGNVYLAKKNYKEAKSNFITSLSFASLQKDSVKIYLNILVYYLKRKEYDTAYFYIHNTLNNFPANLIPYQKAYINQGLGEYFIKKNKYDSAIYVLGIAKASTNDERIKASLFGDLSEAYLKTKNFVAAIKYQDSAAALIKKNNLSENLLLNFQSYATLFEKTGNLEKALYYSKLTKNLSDSIFDIEKNNVTLDLEAKYQNEKTKAEKAIVEKDNSIKQRNLVISFISLSLVALLAFMGLRSARSRKKQNTVLALQKEEVQKLADELSIANDTKARLFSTISHDLRSPLSSLYAQVKLNEIRANTGNEDMSKQTTNLLDTLEDLLVWSKSQMDGFVVQKVKLNMHSFFEECIKMYETTAHFKQINILNSTAKNIFVRTDENILKTICRNIISNAIAHSPHNSNLFLEAYSSEDSTCICIKNKSSKEDFEKLKINFEQEAIKSNAHGFGLTLVKEFAQKVNATIQLSYLHENSEIKIFII